MDANQPITKIPQVVNDRLMDPMPIVHYPSQLDDDAILRKSSRDKRLVIYDDYLVYL